MKRKDGGSGLELLFIAYLEMLAPDLPTPEREVRLIPGRKSQCDFVWLKERLVVEIDGGQWKPHGGRHNSDEDRKKCNTLVALGYRVLHFSGSMLKNDPAGCIDTLRRCLGIEEKQNDL